MSKKVVRMEKDGVETEVPELQARGLEKHGWTVVDDGNKEPEQKPAPVVQNQRAERGTDHKE